MGKNSSKLGPEELEDLKLNTQFTDSEIKEWYKSFTMDFPGGRLNKTQFKVVYKGLFPNDDESHFATLVFKTFDVNGDGVIDFREFMVAMSITSKGSIKDRLEWVFSMYDLDGDGQITRNEMLEIIRSLQSMFGTQDVATPEEVVNQIFDQMDKNGDGIISKEEFIIGARNDKSVSRLMSLNK